MKYTIIVFSYYPGYDGSKLGIEKEFCKEISRKEIDYFLKNHDSMEIKKKYPGIEKLSIDFENKIIQFEFNGIDNGEKFITNFQ